MLTASVCCSLSKKHREGPQSPPASHLVKISRGCVLDGRGKLDAGEQNRVPAARGYYYLHVCSWPGASQQANLHMD